MEVKNRTVLQYLQCFAKSWVTTYLLAQAGTACRTADTCITDGVSPFNVQINERYTSILFVVSRVPVPEYRFVKINSF